MSWLVDFINEFVVLLKEMAPYLLLGFLFAGMLKAWFPEQKVKKYLGKAGFKSSFTAALFGVPMPLCSCGVIPTGVGLYKNGASKSATSSFLISTPQTGVDSILATYSLLGLPFAIIRPIIALITGVFGGMLSRWFDPKQNDEASISETNNHAVQVDKRHPVKTIFSYGFGELVDDIAKWLIIGLVLAGLLSLLIPASFFTQYLGSPLLEMLLVLVASVPLYICATGSIPLAAVLLLKGLSPGAALVLLMAGPATNVATMTVIAKSMGKRALLLYLLAIMIGAFGFGLLINSVFPASWFEIVPMGDHSHSLLPDWVKTVSAIFLVLLLLRVLVMRLIHKLYPRSNRKEINTSNMFTTVKIEGMTCHHCQKNVETNLSNLKGVDQVEVDLSAGTARVSGDLNPAEAEKVIEGLGYTYKGIEH